MVYKSGVVRWLSYTICKFPKRSPRKISETKKYRDDQTTRGASSNHASGNETLSDGGSESIISPCIDWI